MIYFTRMTLRMLRKCLAAETMLHRLPPADQSMEGDTELSHLTPGVSTSSNRPSRYTPLTPFTIIQHFSSCYQFICIREIYITDCNYSNNSPSFAPTPLFFFFFFVPSSSPSFPTGLSPPPSHLPSRWWKRMRRH